MMGSAAAMSLGLGPATTASTAAGDVPEAEAGTDFLAALDAAQPAGASTPLGKAKSQAAKAETATPGDGSMDELVAAMVALLQATPVVAEEQVAVGESDTPEVATGAAALAHALAAGVRGAAKELPADPAAAESDQPDDGLWQALAAKPNTDGATSGSPPAVGLRQLLQMMGTQQAAAEAGADAGDAGLAGNPPQTHATPAAKLVQGAAEFAQAMSAGAAGQGDGPAMPAQPTSTASNSMLAAANLNAPLHQSTPAPATPAASPYTLQSAVGTARWAEELGSRLTLMTLRGQHEGSLNLTPEHLGPLEVRISVHQNTANVWFGAQNADTRLAIAEAMPRLRELLGDAGIALGQSGVSQHAPGQGSRASEAQRHGSGSEGNAIEGPAITQPVTRRVALGLVDTYV